MDSGWEFTLGAGPGCMIGCGYDRSGATVVAFVCTPFPLTTGEVTAAAGGCGTREGIPSSGTADFPVKVCGACGTPGGTVSRASFTGPALCPGCGYVRTG